ncbi:uncharacterized protein LOC132304984 [Cornus florida]|uniref:uncharacterized protein LOC132304984 n=1 Tax=Cornus florida TaxID=4283 RepID=UPI0028A2568F|nr:uncharacterized protein LOC132304984 [Cornus florida]
MAERRSCGKKFLVIIDDIWNDNTTLDQIGIPPSDKHMKGCKVLFTSREKGVWNNMGVQKDFKIELLTENESWGLFQKAVGYVIELTNEIESVAREVCRKCYGLPLAILVVGAALKNQKRKYRWDVALGQLKNCKGEKIDGVNKKLFSRIKWSFEYLKQRDDMLYSCLLYCSLFSEDAEIPIDDLLMYGVGTRFLEGNLETIKKARDTTLVLVDILKESHLLLDGKNKYFVKMHDAIRAVAISIASKEKGFLAKTGVSKWPDGDEYKSRRVISLISQNIYELPSEIECSKLRTLVLECDEDRKPQVPDSFFKGMKKLEVLDLCCVKLPSSPLNLVNLRMLRLYDCEQVNLAFLKELRNLEILSINDYDLKEVAVEVGQLTNLQWLDLSRCRQLKIVPSGVIESLFKIEELYIPHDFGEWGFEGNARLDELNSLKGLTTLQIHIGDGMLLPNELCFKSLNRFKISVGRTKGFGYDEEDLGARMLKLDDISIRKEFNILIENAEALFLQNVEGLKNVLQCGDGKGFLDLKYLRIEDSSDMEHLLGSPKWNFQSHGAFNRLSVLGITRCGMKFLFNASMARALPQLQELRIRGCEIMEEIILDDDEEVMNNVTFHQLKKMELYRLPNLVSICCTNRKKTSSTDCNTSDLAQAFFNEKVSFPALEELKISELESITWIWDNQLFLASEAKEESSFQQLREIEIERCQKLVNVIPSNLIPRLQNLETVEIKGCESVVSAVEVLTIENGSATSMELPQLKSMILESLPKLMLLGLNRKEHSDHRPNIGAYSNLTSLNISDCHSLRNVFSSSIARDLGQLQDLIVIDCEDIEEIIAIETGEGKDEVVDEEIIVFPQLKKMYLIKLPNLKSFCGPKKETVKDDSIPQLQSLFNYKVKFPCLESFEYKGRENNVKEIWDDTVPTDAICKLRVLKVSSCVELVSVAPSKLLGSFHNLKELSILRCDSLEEVFKVEGGSNAEEGMVARDTDIEKDSEDNLVFPQLKSIDFAFLPQLRIFYRRKYFFVILKTYFVWPCPSSLISKVRELQLNNCRVLKDIPTLLLQRFEAVEELRVWGCHSLQVLFSLEGLEDIKRGAPQITKLDPYHNLTSLTVESCNSLKCLFSLSIARNLTNIEQLSVRGCDAIEEIIKNEDQGEEDGAMDEIVFPKLQLMNLYHLPNLTSFCWANNAFKLPSLQSVTLEECDKMQTFTFGQISTPVIELYNEDKKVSDLNNYVQQRAQERKWIAIYKDDEETSIGKEKESGNHDEEDILANE